VSTAWSTGPPGSRRRIHRVTQVGHQQAPGAQAAETLQRRWEALEQNTDTEADRIRGYYSLRHSYGSQLIERGFKLAYVSRALGHASEAITARAYVHEFEAQRTEEDDRAAAMLDEFIG
jgi:integrase